MNLTTHDTEGAGASTVKQDLSPEGIAAALTRGHVDLSALPRGERLKVINGFLNSQKLRALDGLGDKSLGQIELVGINAITPDPVKPGAFVTRVDFQANSYDNGFNHLMYFNAGTTQHSGVVVVPVINGEYILMAHQFRPVVGHLTIEVPRGFVADLGDPTQIKAYGAALIELREETGVDLTQNQHRVTKEFFGWENTGTSNIMNAFLRIDIDLPEDKLKALHTRVVSAEKEFDHKIKTMLIPIKDVRPWVVDNHTGLALFHALEPRS